MSLGIITSYVVSLALTTISLTVGRCSNSGNVLALVRFPKKQYGVKVQVPFYCFFYFTTPQNIIYKCNIDFPQVLGL